jgi:hypothetical protein
VKNGSLAEIAKELTAAAPPDGMVPGSVVMLGATAQLAVVSVEFYAAEWKKARNFLKADLGDIVVLPLFPISASGIKDQRIRGRHSKTCTWEKRRGDLVGRTHCST